MSDLKEMELSRHEKFLFAKLQCNCLDERHTSDMQTKIQQAAEKSPELAVILDMSEVNLLPSLSIGALVSLLQSTSQRQQRFILIGLQPEVRQTLAICRLDKVFEIYDTLDNAGRKINQST